MSKLKLNILIAYPYMTEFSFGFLKERKDDLFFILDSGAFTAWKAGKEITLDSYCKFIESLPIQPDHYLTLDVIGDPEGSLKNYEKMLERGFKPMPVFTRGEDIKMLNEYYKTSDVVAIGGLVGTQNNKGFVKGIMPHVGTRKVHWLGFTNERMLKVYRPYSCDASSFKGARRYGQVEIFDIKTMTWVKLSKKDYKPGHDAVMRSYDIDPMQLIKNENWSGNSSFSTKLSFRSHVRASIYYERAFGTKYVLAAAGERIELTMLYDSFLKERAIT